LLAWSPLAGGAIADPRDARGQAVQRALADIASAHAVSVDTAALAFLLRHPAGVIPIVGTRRIDRLAEAERALAVEIDRASFYRVVEASRGARMP
jgi:predicted oxidoreductase